MQPRYDFDTVIDRKNTGCFKADGLKLLFGKADLLPLWVADMDFAIAPEILEAMQARLSHPIFGYNLRLDAYYESIINWVDRRYGWQIERDWIISTPGIVTALNIAVVTLTEPGDGILVQTPVYDPFFEAVQANDRKLLTNPLSLQGSRYEIDFDDFEVKLKQAKMFFLCSPHNPVGRAWSETELLKIGRLCRKYKVIVVADEIHADLVYSGNTHRAFAALEDFNQFTLTCYSPSKSFNLAGLCTSAIVISNPKLRKSFNDYVQTMHLYLGNSFGITALKTAYESGYPWLQALLKYLEQNRDMLCDYIDTKLPRLKAIKPEATFLAWIDCRSTGLNDQAISDLLINQAGLALNPGKTYGTDGSGFVRINFGCPRSVLSLACDKLFDIFK